MKEFDFEPDPEANSYYRRLDIPQNATHKEIKKAGKVAFKHYREQDKEAFFSLKRARETLENSNTRDAYDLCIDQLGVEEGTEVFEEWKKKGRRVDIEQLINKKRAERKNEREQPTRIDAEKIQYSNPSVELTSSNVPEDVSVRLGRKKAMNQLRISNFHTSGDIYLNLDTGEIHNHYNHKIADLEAQIHDDGETLELEHQGRVIKISLIGSDETEQQQSKDNDKSNSDDEGSRESAGENDQNKKPTWLQRQKNSLVEYASDIWGPLGGIVTLGYGLLWLVVVPIAYLSTLLSLVLGALSYILLGIHLILLVFTVIVSIIFQEGWSPVIEAAIDTIYIITLPILFIVLGAVSSTILELFNVDPPM